MKKSVFLLSFTTMMALWSCSNSSSIKNEIGSVESEPTETIGIDKPIKEISDKTVHFTVRANEPTTLTAPSGSKIIIPKDAFVDESGEPISGEIDIAFEEFHSNTDIILSGIPMNITSENGDMGNLESAGMFRIEGEHNGKEVFVAPNKQLEIDLISFREEDDFNFYEFDEAKAMWIEKGKSVATENTERSAALAELSEEKLIKPIAIKKAESTDFVFDLDVDKARNPEFNYFDNVLWKMADNEAKDEAMFKTAIRQPNLQCIDADRSIFTLTGRIDGRTITKKVQPVLFGSNWKKANAAFKEKMSSYNTAKAERKRKQAAIDEMGLVRRSAMVNNFGVYNFDRIMKLRRRVEMRALFFLPALRKVVKRAFLIEGKNKGAIPYTFSPSFPFMFDPNEKNHLIAFDEDGNLYEFTHKDFEQTDFKKARRDAEFTFRMKETDVQVHNEQDLNDYLASLK